MFSNWIGRIFVVLILLVSGMVLWLSWSGSLREAGASDQDSPVLDLPDTPHRERDPGVDSPNISFIDSQTPQCYLSEPGSGDCYINWNYLYVSAASSSYIISMTVTINNELVAYHGGFFQTNMYVPGTMLNPGFHVVCGAPGAGGNNILGNSYSYTIRARETGGLKAANYGTVYCPADLVRTFLPIARKR